MLERRQKLMSFLVSVEFWGLNPVSLLLSVEKRERFYASFLERRDWLLKSRDYSPSSNEDVWGRGIECSRRLQTTFGSAPWYTCYLEMKAFPSPLMLQCYIAHSIRFAGYQDNLHNFLQKAFGHRIW